MTTADLDRLEELAKAASPGPWKTHPSWDGQSFVETPRSDPELFDLFDADDRLIGQPRIGAREDGPVIHTFDMRTPDRDRHNAAYIAAVSPDVVLAMIELLRATVPSR